MRQPANDNDSIALLTQRIFVVRGERVMLDADLAKLYGVPTKRLNEQVKRNAKRFPPDFMFRLNLREWREMWSQFATTSQDRRRNDAVPIAMTEHGCVMLANVLKSERAIEASVLIVRAFVRLRSAVLVSQELAQRVDKLGKHLGRRIDRQGKQLVTHEREILEILEEIRRLTRFPEPAHREIGFTAKWRDPPPE